MKNIVCPYSPDRVSENTPRIIALFAVILLVIYVYTNWIIIPAFLLFDFFVRGFLESEKSILLKIAKVINSKFLKKGKMIDKAPKLFAARLGILFSLMILVADVIGLSGLSVGLSIVLILFASLEGVMNFCVGCWVYSFFVLPFYSKV